MPSRPFPTPSSPAPASPPRRSACPPPSPPSPARTSRSAATSPWPRRWSRYPACGWCRAAGSAARPALPPRQFRPPVLVLLDGVPLNDPSEANGAFNFGNDLLFDVERIEVLRGPTSALYGSAAIGGVINLVTRRAPAGPCLPALWRIGRRHPGTLRGGLGAAGTVGRLRLPVVRPLDLDPGFNAMAPRFQATLGERDGFRGAFSTARLGWTPQRGHAGRGVAALAARTISAWTTYRGTTRTTRARTAADYGQLRGETRLFDGAWTTGLRIVSTEDRRATPTCRTSSSAATRGLTTAAPVHRRGLGQYAAAALGRAPSPRARSASA